MFLPLLTDQPPAHAAGRLTERLPDKPGAESRLATTVLGETGPGGRTPAIYIVQLGSAPLASYRGGVPDLAPTSPSITGEPLDLGRAADRAYAAYLGGRQSAVLADIEQLLGRQVEVKSTYQAAFNGFALVLSPKEAALVGSVPVVLRIQRDAMAYPQTDRGLGWINAPAVWSGEGVTNTMGEGVVVGILDTGINFQSPSFARVGGDNFIPANPRLRYYGVCDQSSDVYSTKFACNEKLIGAWDFADGLGSGTNNESDGPADNNGHGSHTASTAAGNFVSAAMVAPTLVVTASLSGVAPHASIIVYDVCLPSGCPYSALVAGHNQAVIDGVDVINFSIGGESSDPWQRPDALAMLAALDAGIFVAVSAGNDGPDQGTTSSPGNAPWVTTAGAVTHDRRFANELTNLTGSTGPLADISGRSITRAAGPAPIVDAADYTNVIGMKSARCTAPYPPGTFTGEIVLCERGVNGRVEKGDNVLTGGAAGMILMNDPASGSSLSADAHFLPAVNISNADGIALRNWLATGLGHSGAISGTVREVNPGFGDVRASFSSRGPDSTSPDVLKPDLVAPGVDVLAASHLGGNYAVMSGTSTASPHLAGAAALLAAQHPAWTPAEIRSAMMLSASAGVRMEDGVTPAGPLADGAGRIDLGAASRLGLVLDESAYAFETANPRIGGQPQTLNLASLADSNCIQTCTWTRTLRSVLDRSATYTVSATGGSGLALNVEPAAFTLAPGATQALTITADVSAAPIDVWVLGSVGIQGIAVAHGPGATAAMPLLAMPEAARARVSSVPAGLDEIQIETRRSAGVSAVAGFQAITTPTLVKNLWVASTEDVTGTVAPDPTPSDVWDIEAGGVYTRLLTVADPGAAMLGVQIVDSTAVDLDLYVGRDDNGDGQPSADEILCNSATATFRESCGLSDLGVGTYWVLLHSWQGSGAAADSFTMIIERLERNHPSAAMTVTGPEATTAGVPFAVDIHWNQPALRTGDRVLVLLELGTSASRPNDIASLPVKLIRLADDVQITSTADAEKGKFAQPGERVDFTISIDPELTATSPTNYVVTATLPAGMTYVPGTGGQRTSAGAVPLEPVVDGAQLVWTVTGVETAPHYVQSTNDPESPLYSPSCDTPFGGYIHLEDFGIPLQPQVEGDGRTWNIDSFYEGGMPYSFFGKSYPQLFFTDDGLLSVAGMDPHLNSGANAPIPTAALPNGLLAPVWGAFKIVYDKATGSGVRIAGMGGGQVMFLEYDGLQSAATPGSINVEAIIRRQVDPDAPEITFAFDGATGVLPATVTGLENATGTAGIAYDGPVGASGQVICYEWTADQVELTFSATIDADASLDAQLETTVASTLSAPEAKQAAGSSQVFVTGVVLSAAQTGPARALPGSPITYTLTVTNSGVGAATGVNVLAELPYDSRRLAGGELLPNGVVSFTIPSLVAGSAARLDYSFELDTTAQAGPDAALRAQSPSIIGGEVAADGAWPWQAALWNNSHDTQLGCGGSLVAPTWVLTAAHCVTGADDVVRYSPSQISVVLGVNDLTKIDQGQRIQVTEIIAQPQFERYTYDNDIALLRLAAPAVLNDKVQIVPMAAPFDAALFAPGVPAVVTGWGTLTAGKQDYPDRLYQVEVPIVAQNICEFAYASRFGDGAITPNMICAGLPEGGKDACQGDSGGPLVVHEGSGWKQAGIVSWGQGCALPAFPGVYTRLANYSEYVSDVQHTLTSRGFSANDGTGRPGHAAAGMGVISTLVKPIRLFLPALRAR